MAFGVDARLCGWLSGSLVRWFRSEGSGQLRAVEETWQAKSRSEQENANRQGVWSSAVREVEWGAWLGRCAGRVRHERDGRVGKVETTRSGTVRSDTRRDARTGPEPEGAKRPEGLL